MFPFSREPKDAKPEPDAPAPAPKAAEAHPLDAATGGVFSAATSGERAQRLREWLASDPAPELMQDVYKDLSAKDKGAAKALRERLDELRRAKGQEAVAAEWAAKAEALLASARLNIADALAWQRDAAKAGAPLSREPLAALRTRLVERIKNVEDLQQRVMVQREAALLMAQRIELLSTKPWRDAEGQQEGLRADVDQWRAEARRLLADPQWLSVDVRYPPQLESAQAQLGAVWEAFTAALGQASAAAADAAVPLPTVPVWADELRAARGEPAGAAGASAAAPAEKAAKPKVDPEQRAAAQKAVEAGAMLLEQAVAAGHTKNMHSAAQALRQSLKAHGRLIDDALEARVHAALISAGELEGWQRWSADKVREQLLARAEALLVKRPRATGEARTPRPRRAPESRAADAGGAGAGGQKDGETQQLPADVAHAPESAGPAGAAAAQDVATPAAAPVPASDDARPPAPPQDEAAAAATTGSADASAPRAELAAASADVDPAAAEGEPTTAADSTDDIARIAADSGEAELAAAAAATSAELSPEDVAAAVGQPATGDDAATRAAAGGAPAVPTAHHRVAPTPAGAAAAAQPADEPSTAHQPTSDRPASEQPAADRPVAERAASAPSAGAAAAADATAGDASATPPNAVESADASAAEASPAERAADETEEWVPAMGPRKLQEAIRKLREEWKAADQGGAPNHGLWKRFDRALNAAHKHVDEWVTQVRAESAAHRAQRMALIDEVRAWGAAQQGVAQADWKAFNRQIHQFSERWRAAGHLSEKQFAELQPQWKQAIHQAAAPLEAAQQQSTARRQALIEEAEQLAATHFRIDAVRALQQRWQAEAQAVPLDRKHEQRLWDAFRKPLDAAFDRRGAERERQQQAMSDHDRAVLDAARALEAANASGDAQRIRAAMNALEAATRGQIATPASQAKVPAAPANAAPGAPENEAAGASGAANAPNAAEASAATGAPADAAGAPGAADAATSDAEAAGAGAPASEAESGPPAVAGVAAAPAPKPAKPLVAMRGDDRPGARRPDAAATGRAASKFGDRRDGRPGGPGGRPGQERGAPGGGRGFGADRGGAGSRFGDRAGAGRFGDRGPREERGPRLGDAAFRAQRDAVEQAEAQLRRLAAQAHGEALTQLLGAWQRREPAQVPSAQELGRAVTPSVRTAWTQAIAGKDAASAERAAEALLRLEMAAEVPTPADQLDARRQLQLKLLTRRNDPPPNQTWGQDAAAVLAAPHDDASARRLQNALKAMLRR